MYEKNIGIIYFLYYMEIWFIVILLLTEMSHVV